MKEKRKTHKSLLTILLVVLILPCCLLFTGCSEVYVSSIEYSYTKGSDAIYTVTYSNGKTSTIEVPGAEVTAKDIFNACVERGIYQNTDEDFKKFVSVYLTPSDVNSTKLNIYQSMNSAVSVWSAFPLNLSGFRRGTDVYEVDTGSGVIFSMNSENTFIVTNSHVITHYSSSLSHKLPEEIVIYPYGYEPYVAGNYIDNTDYLSAYEFRNGINAEVVGYSVEHDLAVLKVNTADLTAKNKDACAVPLAAGYSLLDEVFVIGNPYGNGISVTKGIVSVYSEEMDISSMPADGLTHTYRIMRIDNAVYEGNSGGGVFDANGKLVGIINAGLEGCENYSFAIPIDQVVPCVENLIYYGTQTPAYSVKSVSIEDLGVTTKNVYKDFNETSGLLSYNVAISNVKTNSFLYNKVKVGEIITAVNINGKTTNITWQHQINDILMNARSNSTVSLTVKDVQANTKTVDISTYLASHL